MKSEILIECEKLDHFGRGISRINGKPLFVPNLLPTEKALVKITQDKKKFSVGEIIELKEKSKDRICSKCPYETCGCALKNMKYEKTLMYKKENVKDVLRKFGNITIDEIEIVPSKNIYNYRNKITLKVDHGKIGYYKNNTNELIEIDKCYLATEKINKIISKLKKENLENVREIIIKDMKQLMLIIKGEMNIDNLKKYCDSIYINDKLVFGAEKILNQIGDYNFYVSKDSFFQVNNYIATELYFKVLEYCKGGKNLLDLYCGTGTISLFLSKYFDHVTGVEINKEAVKCANENKKINNITNVDFICKDANKIKKSVDTIVLDPARSGITEEGVKNIFRIKPKKIVYVSCNPITLATNLKELSKSYKLKEIFLFDMFPWTYHVECVCLLCLNDG